MKPGMEEFGGDGGWRKGVVIPEVWKNPTNLFRSTEPGIESLNFSHPPPAWSMWLVASSFAGGAAAAAAEMWLFPGAPFQASPCRAENAFDSPGSLGSPKVKHLGDKDTQKERKGKKRERKRGSEEEEEKEERGRSH